MKSLKNKIIERIVLYWYLECPNPLWDFLGSQCAEVIEVLYLGLNFEMTWNDWMEKQDWDAIAKHLNWFSHEISSAQAKLSFQPNLTQSTADAKMAEIMHKLSCLLSDTFVFDE